MSGLRNDTLLLKGEEAHRPNTARINFPCPNVKVLQNYNPLGDTLPDTFKPGILTEMIEYKAEKSESQESFVLMLDGKKMKRGADVDLLGCETGETLSERRAQKIEHECVIERACEQISEIQNETNVVKDTPTERKPDIILTLTGILMLFSTILRKLRSLRKGKQYSLNKLKEQGGKEWKKSKYAFSIDLQMTIIWKIDNCVEKNPKSYAKCVQNWSVYKWRR